MTDILLLVLGSDPEAPVAWGALGDGRLIEHGRLENAAALALLAEKARAARSVIALLPGEQVAMRWIESPPKSPGKLVAAARYLMEDELGDASGLAVASAPFAGAGLAIATEAGIVAAWREAFAAAGLHLDALYPDYLAPSADEGAAVLVADETRAVFAARGRGFSLETSLALELAPRAMEGLAQLAVYGPARLPAVEGVAIERRPALDEAGYLALLASGAAAKAPPSFIERPLFRRGALAAAAASWRRAGMLAAALAALVIAGYAASAARADFEASHWTRAARTLHAKAHPDAAAQPPDAYARDLLAEGAADGTFLALSSRVAAAVRAQGGVAVDRVVFSAARREYALVVQAPTDAAIESFKTALREAGVVIEETGGFRRVGEVWSGEIRARLP